MFSIAPPCLDTATLTLGPLASKALARGATPWTGSRTTTQSFWPSDFPSCLWNGARTFKLLGARYESLLGKRVSSKDSTPRM